MYRYLNFLSILDNDLAISYVMIVDTFKFICKSLFGTHRGAYTLAQRILFGCLRKISTFDLTAELQMGMTYVQPSLNIDLQSSSLFLLAFLNWRHVYETLRSSFHQ